MKQTIKNIRSAYNDDRRFANTSSNSGIVEFTHAVRAISAAFYYEVSVELMNGKMAGYKFIQEKMNEYKWDGLQFNKELPKYQNQEN